MFIHGYDSSSSGWAIALPACGDLLLGGPEDNGTVRCRNQAENSTVVICVLLVL